MAKMKIIEYGECPICGNLGELVETKSEKPQTACEVCVEEAIDGLRRYLRGKAK